MTAFELAKKYYPLLWSAERIRALIAAGKLTEEEAEQVMNPAPEAEET